MSSLILVLKKDSKTYETNAKRNAMHVCNQEMSDKEHIPWCVRVSVGGGV